jgi:serine protease Do
MRHFRQIGTIVLVLLCLSRGPAMPPANAQEMQYNQAALIRGLLPTVVNISAHAVVKPDTTTMRASSNVPSEGVQIKYSAGSGFVVDPSGVIVTNWHVVDGAYEIFVTFSDGSRLKADLFNAARIIDIALLKVDAGHPLQAARWGDSAKVQVGDPVLAIGNPLGVGMSVTAGIVSALNRNINDTPYDDFIQTDAAINHGNSGGPLFDLHGEVIGVNSALISTTSASAGLGFAIPSRDAQFIVDRLIHFGWVRPGWLGVKIQEVTPELADALAMAEPKGAIVAWVVEGGPAAKAGLQLGDVIVRFADEEPSDERALLRDIAASIPGRQVTLGLLRAGKPVDLPVTLAEWPKMQWEQRDAPIKVEQPRWTIPPDLGIKVTPLTQQLAQEHAIAPTPRTDKAVYVTGVEPDSDAARRGVAVGDLILQVGTAPIGNADEYQREVDRARAEKRDYAMVLVLPKTQADPATKWPGPKWLALRVLPE